MDAFESLFFGSGMWFGLLFYLTVIGLTSLKVKYLCVLYLPLTLLLVLQYIERATDENNLFWCAIIMAVSIPFMLFNLWKGKSDF